MPKVTINLHMRREFHAVDRTTVSVTADVYHDEDLITTMDREYDTPFIEDAKALILDEVRGFCENFFEKDHFETVTMDV